MLKELCRLNAASGSEGSVRDFVINEIKKHCEYRIDPLGSIIAYKKGRKTPKKSVMLCAHMDEVAFIVTYITDDGYLKFRPVGGVDARAVIGRAVEINGRRGVIGVKAVHLLSADEAKTAPDFSDLYIDIGAESREQALRYVSLGDNAYFVSDYIEFGDGFIKSKALDDRIGCMLMLELIKSNLEFDTCFCFNAQEEVGLRGAACTSYAVQSDISVILEATTAADICGVAGGDRCCVLGDGPVISFMDGKTVYDRALFDLALDTAAENGIKAQTKTVVAGGNDAGAVQVSGKGSRVLAISLPCRYIHSAVSTVKISDIDETRKLLKALLVKLYD